MTLRDNSVPTKLSSTRSELLIYQTEDGRTRIQFQLEDETVWLTQKLMSYLLQKRVRTINEHIRNILAKRELSPESVIRNFRITETVGKAYETNDYNHNVEVRTCMDFLRNQTGLKLDMHPVQSTIINRQSKMTPC